MKYDFDKMTDRRGINSLKWDVGETELPLWVADMDFEVCPAIVSAMEERLKKPTFGYNIIPDEWYSAYINWWSERHGLKMERDALFFSAGVVPSISSIIRRLTLPAEKVLIQTPVYNIFFNSIYNNGRFIKESPLNCDRGVYGMDFAALDKDLSDPQVTLMILCNPHNPIGKNWDRETLAEIGRLCDKHNVKVISDEIHCDVQAPGASYVPFATASDTCKKISVTLVAPTKAFNIAGLQTSAVYVPDSALRRTVVRGLNNDEIAEPNTFAVCAAVAAFERGGEWLEQMNAYVSENKKIVYDFIESGIPLLKTIRGDATYLVWIDAGAVCEDSVTLTRFVREKTGLYLSDGAEYGDAGRRFLRMNATCPKTRLYDALQRLLAAVQMYLQ